MGKPRSSSHYNAYSSSHYNAYSSSHYAAYSSSNYIYPSSSQDYVQHAHSYSQPPWGPVTPHPKPNHHHPWTTSTSSPWKAPMASDNRSTSAVPSKTPTPLPVAASHHDKDLSTGALAAAVVLPILVVFSAILLIFLCLRKRRKTPPAENAPVVAAAGMKEKLGSFRRRRPPPPPTPAPQPMSEPPILTSQHNNAYLTGLDTSSIGSRGDSGEYQVRASYTEPPPPYIHEPSPPSLDAQARSPFDDPPEEYHVADGLYPAPHHRPWNTSNVSVSSTLYSDNVSMHEAKEARRSLTGARVVDAMSITSEGADRRVSNPFVSPVGSPASPTFPIGEHDRWAGDITELDRK